MENNPHIIIFHHSADPATGHQAEKINAYHKTRDFTLSSLGFYGGYHILIEKDGTAFRFRNDNEIGCHTFNRNVNSLGICLAGNFDVEVPTDAQHTALHKQLNDWIQLYSIPKENIYPHRHFRATDCPGKKLYDTWASDILNDPLPPEQPQPQAVEHDACQ